MSDMHPELARLWIEKADNDVITARQTLLLPDGPTDTVCFHAQQATEKALKALMTCHGIAFPKIHDLVRLLDIALPLMPQLDDYRERFAEMSAYAVQTRYPAHWPSPGRDQALRAMAVAQEILAMVRQHAAEQT